MRPAGEVRQALFKAACELAQQYRHADVLASRGATLKELAAAAQVGLSDANVAVKNMTRTGRTTRLRRVAERRVAYRNRPVGEYLPVEPADALAPTLQRGSSALNACLSSWTR